MKKLGILVAVLCLAWLGLASAQGMTLQQAQRAGFTCINVGDDLGHCLNTSTIGKTAVTLLVFESMAPNARLISTEILLHERVYHDQPCPTEGATHWHYLGGLPYYACHHYTR
jgi:hypothetical protein